MTIGLVTGDGGDKLVPPDARVMPEESPELRRVFWAAPAL
jgi:hypothetical protein